MIDTTDATRPYSEYRPSGDDWLGGIPAHWRTTSLGAISGRKSLRNRPDLPLLSVLREKGVILRSSLSQEENHNFIPDDLSNYQVANEGDLVVNKMKAWQGSVGIAPQDGIVSPAYYIFKLTEMKKGYAQRLLRSRLYADFFARASDGVRIGQWDLGITAMKRIPVLIPPPEEQERIARYLGGMDQRIAYFIRNRQRLIEVLNEQKQAIINRAVTRGLDPDVRLKPSGVEWLGDIPEHWEVRRIRTLVRRIDQGVSPQAENVLAGDGACGVLKSGCVNHGVFRPEQHKRLPDGFQFDPMIEVSPGDILVSRASGSPHLVGSVGQVTASPYKLILSDKTFRLIFRSHSHIGFFLYAMNSPMYRRQVRLAISGAEGLANNLPLSSLRNFIIPTPPNNEAQQVAEMIVRECSDVVQGISVAQREIDLIREYRTRLIADVVTGKVDVRHLAPPPGSEELEEAVDKLEPLGDAEGEMDDEARIATK